MMMMMMMNLEIDFWESTPLVLIFDVSPGLRQCWGSQWRVCAWKIRE